MLFKAYKCLLSVFPFSFVSSDLWELMICVEDNVLYNAVILVDES